MGPLVRTPLALAGDAPGVVSTDPTIDALLAAHAPVAIGVSGGKDSVAAAAATVAYLDRAAHAGPRLLIHADLGLTEWQDSLPVCERLAAVLGLELVVVKRPQGGMMERWEQRWADNARRWAELACVKLILPWSTPAMRFCTAELKVDQITRYLCRRFPGKTILNATGIRWEESEERAKQPVGKDQPKLESKTNETAGYDWHPIISWSTDQVYRYIADRGLPLHEAYTVYGASRVSCVWCILAKLADHRAAIKDRRNHVLGVRMVELEAKSTFGFQGSRWLGDTIAELLPKDLAARLARAKEGAALRERAEARLPKDLLYVKGWPTRLPTIAEARLLGHVRADVAEAVGLKPTFTAPDDVVARYAELLRLKAEKAAKAEKIAARKRAKSA